MSLFKVVQWLDYQCPDQEKNYDSFSLTCARFNVDNETNKETIIISSHSGYITIIRNPTNHEAKEIIELKLNAPILGVSCGNFVAQPQRPVQNIAILHPTQLAIYSLITPSEAGHETGNRGKLQLIVSHDLEKSAFSFCKGNFGGEKNKEFLCVMFLDGSLRFFEQDFTGQRCILPGDHAIPACFIYVPRTDCFILLSASWDLECYRYLSLSESYERKLNPIWSMCVGECIIDINQHQVSNSESLIVLLGEKSLISVSDTGKVKFVRKFDYTPLCFCSFVVGWYFEPNCKLMIGVVTDQGSLLIYHNATLVWCATLPFHPVLAVQRGNFSELNGGLVMLSESGKVSVGYLGSNPVMFKVPPLNLSNLNYENSKQMLEEMEREINANIDLQDFEFINVEASKNFNLTTKVRLEGLTDGELAVLHIDVEILTNLEQIQIFIPEDPTMTTQPNIFFLKDCKVGETHARDFKMYTSDGLLPSSVTILVSFINKQSVARIVKSCVSLPLDSFLERRPPQKDAHFKATLTFSQSVEVLGFLSDLNTEKAIGLKILNSEHEATIIKKANKFRLQSSSIQSLGFFTSYLAKHVKKEEKCQTTLTINSPALDYLIDSIQKYFNATEGMDETKESLNKETSQIRIFERCHLLKMQEKAIKMERSQIDILLLDTIDEILNLSKKLKADGIEGQLKSIVHHFGMIIECIENPQQKKNHQELMVVFKFLHNEETNWLEAVAPFVDYLYSKHELRQFENFSLSKFNKHLRSIMSILVDANRIQEDLKE